MSGHLGKDRVSTDEWIIAHAELFKVVAFRGRAIYDRMEVKTLKMARLAAVSMYKDRPVAIYAVAGLQSCHVENWEPKRKIRRMKRSKLNG